MKLGEYIREYRSNNRMSQRDFAQVTGLSAGYVSMLESGKNPRTGDPIAPSLETMRSIARATGKDLDALLELIDDDTLVSLETNEEQELNDRILNLVRRLPVEKKLSLLDLLTATVQGVRKK